ncbi:hypothetical protein H4N58_20170 [Mumia sp. ZJ1417]|uniref:hypothetical protein n=1 Tax=Mumia sp. ZJ1417 TaxID=2708082 RepID=UPI00141DF797|nr:hypothetical protein [Mumia sp. ZJ1417]QMW66410.1 hypothetical protein H4N58_20170 [Mumia sp. ZJ1417]
MAGPAGGRARPSRWWTPVRILLATAMLVGTLGLVTKGPCAVDSGSRWFSEKPVAGGASYARLCASELPQEYATTGLAERVAPWSEAGGRWPVNAVTLPVGALQHATAAVVHTLARSDVDARAARDATEVERDRSVRREAVAYTGLVAVGSLLLLLLALVALARSALSTNATRPWPSWSRPVASLMPLAASPLIALLIGVGWDLVGVALVAWGLAAWTAARARLAGLVLGVAVLAAWWPVVVLLVLGATALLRHGAAAGRLLGSATLTVAVGGVVAFAVTAGDAVTEPVRRWLDHEGGVGSLWAVLAELGVDVSSTVVVPIVIGLWAFAVSVTFLYAARSGDVSQTARYAFVLLAALLLVGTTYAPGYALWLLPLAVLAHPVWRDLLWWQAAEVFLVVATWWHLGDVTKPAGDTADVVYVVAIALHVVATVWLAARMQRSAAGRGVPASEQPNVVDQLGR